MNKLLTTTAALMLIAPAMTAGTVGYVGPSTMTRIARGVTHQFPEVDAWDGNVLQNLNGSGFDGCDTMRWLDQTSYCWANFLEMLDVYPATDRLVMMVAFKPGYEIDVATIRQLTNTLSQRCSVPNGCEVILIGLPEFIDTCGEMPTNGLPAMSRLQASRAALTSRGLPRPGVCPGPQLSAIGVLDVSDNCHQNGEKAREHARQLLPWIQ